MNMPRDTILSASSAITSMLVAFRERAVTGITWVVFGQMFHDLLYVAVTSLDSVQTLSGVEKKQIVLTATASLFDTVADRCVGVAAWPAWVIIRPAARTLLLAIASGIVESLLPKTREIVA